ncbi:MAG: hypothetical protein QM723_22975 [Myxococcaceae bacterium]
MHALLVTLVLAAAPSDTLKATAVGLEVQQRTDGELVVSKSASPSVAVGDQLVAVLSGDHPGSLEGKTLCELWPMLLGQVGETVELRLLRAGKTFDVKLTRADPPELEQQVKAATALPPGTPPEYVKQLADVQRNMLRAMAMQQPQMRCDSVHLEPGERQAERTSESVWVEAEVRYLCTNEVAESLTVNGVTQKLGDLQGGMTRVRLASWPAKAAAEACSSGRPKLEKEVKLELRCVSGHLTRSKGVLTASLDCASGSGVAEMYLEAKPFPPVEGAVAFHAQANLTGNLKPERVVMKLFDPSGAVAQTMAAKTDEWRATQDFSVAHAAAGLWKVEAEATYADRGTRKWSGAMKVRTQAEADDENHRFKENSDQMTAFTNRMNKEQKFCDLAWIKAQPEVASVSVSSSGDYSVFFKAGQFPLAMLCHHH